MTITNPSITFTFVASGTSASVTSSDILSRSISVERTRINELHSASEILNVSLKGSCALVDDILGAEEDILAVVKDGLTTIFTGYVSTDHSWRINTAGEEGLSLSIEDVGTRLLQRTVCDDGYTLFQSTVDSAITAICTRCGITKSPTCPTVSTAVLHECSAEDVCADILDTMLYEAGYVHYFDASGRLSVQQIAYTSPVTTFDSSNLMVVGGTAVSFSKKIRQYRSAKMSFKPVYTYSGTDYLVYRNTTSGGSGHTCDITIPSGYAFDGVEVYDYAAAQADTYRVDALIGGCNASSEQNTVGSGEIVGVSSLSLDWSGYGGALTCSVTSAGGKYFKILVRNASGSVAHLTKCDVYGSVKYTKETEAIRTSSTAISGSSDSCYTEEMSYVCDKPNAQKHANLVSQWHQYCGMTYSFYSTTSAALGEVCRLHENVHTGLDVNVMVVGYKETDESAVREYSAVGISSFSLTADVYHGKQKPGVTIPESVKPVSSSTMYGSSAAENTEPTTWTSTLPTSGAYIWTKVTTTYSDGSTSVSKSVMANSSTPQVAKYLGAFNNSSEIGATPIYGDTAVFYAQGGTTDPKTFQYDGSNWVQNDKLLAEHAVEIVAYMEANNLDYQTLTIGTAYIKKLVAGSGSFDNMNVLNFNATGANITAANVTGMLEAAQSGTTVLKTFVGNGSTYTQPNVSISSFTQAYCEYDMLQSLADYVGVHGTKTTGAMGAVAGWSMTLSGTYNGTAFSSVKIGVHGGATYSQATVSSGVLQMGCQNMSSIVGGDPSAATPGSVEYLSVSYSHTWVSSPVCTFSGYTNNSRFFSMSPFSSMPSGSYPVSAGTLNGVTITGDCTKATSSLTLNGTTYSAGQVITAFTLTGLVLNMSFTGVKTGDVIPLSSGKNIGSSSVPYTNGYMTNAVIGGITYNSSSFNAPSTSNGMIALANGLKISYGTVSLTSNTSQTVSYTGGAFSNRVLAFCACPQTGNTSDAYARTWFCSSITTTGFTFKQKDSNRYTSLYYIAIGV